MVAQDLAHLPQGEQSPAEVAAGKTQFAQSCSFCHGANARGATGPDLIESALVSHDVNGNLIGEVVRNGRTAKGMPAFQFSDAQIRSIAAYLHSEARLAFTAYRRGPGDYSLDKLLVGKAPAGEKVFAAKCASCHSPSGDLAHVATKYQPVDLQSRIAFPAGAVPSVTVTEPSGVTVTGSEAYADEFTVSLKDKNGWIHTWDRRSVKVEIKDPLQQHEKLLFAYTDRELHDLFAYLETLK